MTTQGFVSVGCAFVDNDVRYSYDSDDVVSVNTGGITSFSAGVDGDGAVGAGTGVSVVNKRIAIVSGDVRGYRSSRIGGNLTSCMSGSEIKLPCSV